ncbi:MAG TPA: sulfur carrier protein ThiS [Dehalococcoidia bacterium]|nr:sulfur carrier protein ThiS [Dehalococcoidia bacterium]
MITLTINGKQRELAEEMLLPQLLEQLGIDRRLVAVAHNGDVIPRDRYDRVCLRNGDTVEIVRMVGGG